jgi:small subunit ribosomal protein S4
MVVDPPSAVAPNLKELSVARYTGPVCRLCRRENLKLYLKGERCYTSKCAIEKKKSAPGQHGLSRSKLSDFGIQLREKQRLKRYYGMLETQFRRFFELSAKEHGEIGLSLLQKLEMRLDSVVFALGVGLSRTAARQLVSHNFVFVNGKRCNIPSRILKSGDQVTFKPGLEKLSQFVLAQDRLNREEHNVPPWLNWNSKDHEAKVLQKPNREEIKVPFNEQLVVELYSK